LAKQNDDFFDHVTSTHGISERSELIPASRLSKKVHPSADGWLFILRGNEKAWFRGAHKNKEAFGEAK
jgi:hypothetical protein